MRASLPRARREAGKDMPFAVCTYTHDQGTVVSGYIRLNFMLPVTRTSFVPTALRMAFPPTAW